MKSYHKLIQQVGNWYVREHRLSQKQLASVIVGRLSDKQLKRIERWILNATPGSGRQLLVANT